MLDPEHVMSGPRNAILTQNKPIAIF